MSKTLALALVLVFLTASSIIVSLPVSGATAEENTWVEKAPMHQARAYLEVAVADGQIYAIGGDEGSETGNVSPGTSMTNNAVNYTEEYNPSADTWTSKAPMPTARALFGTAVYQNKIYCIGGYNGANIFVGPENWNWKTEYYDIGANEVYNPVTNTWEIKAPMPTPRYSSATNIVNGKIYVIGGHTMTNLYITLNVTEVYDPETNSWTTRTSPPLQVSNPASAVVDNKIYVLGDNPTSSGNYVIQIYDPASDRWNISKPAPVSYHPTAVATTGENTPKRIYFFDENKTDVFDPSTDSWTLGSIAPTDRLIAKAAVVNDIIYLIGGRTGQWGYMTFMYPSTLNEQYTPMGYGNPDLSTPEPATTLSPSQSTSPTSSPTLTASTPTPAVPEFPSLTIPLLLCIMLASAGLLVYHKKHKQK